MNNSANLTDSGQSCRKGGQSCRKSQKVSTKSGWLSIVCIQLGPRKLAVIRIREVAVKQGFLKNGDTVRTKVSVHYRQGGRESGVAIRRGSTVFLFSVSVWLCSCEKNTKPAQLHCSHSALFESHCIVTSPASLPNQPQRGSISVYRTGHVYSKRSTLRLETIVNSNMAICKHGQ